MKGVVRFKKIIVIVLTCTILSGCGYFSVTNTTTKQVTSTQRSVPPRVEIEVKNETYSTKQGSYCWSTVNVSECVDMISPSELVQDYDAIQVSPGELITVQIDRKPIEQGINVEALDSVEVEPITMDGNTFNAPTEKGAYILMFYAHWDVNGLGTSGDSSYVFKVDVQ